MAAFLLVCNPQRSGATPIEIGIDFKCFDFDPDSDFDNG